MRRTSRPTTPRPERAVAQAAGHSTFAARERLDLAIYPLQTCLAMAAAGTPVAVEQAAPNPSTTTSSHVPPAIAPFWLAWASAAAIVATFEWLLLVLQVPSAFLGGRHMVKLLPLMVGHWLPYALLGVASFRLVGWAALELQRRFAEKWTRAIAAFGAGVLALPYTIGLAKFTFSGPQARALQLHSLLVVATTVLVALGFALAAWLSTLRFRSQALRLGWVVAMTTSAGVLLWWSRKVLPSEYEPLHQFLALLALVAASLVGDQLGRLRPPKAARHEAIGAGALVVWAGVAGTTLANSEGDSWILWSHTAGSRYLTERWTFATSEVSSVGDGNDAPFVLRPDLETELTRAWRAQRAERPAPNIVIFSIDGLLPSRVGAYGYTARPTTPNIDRMARGGVRFTRAFSTYPATKQFNSSLLLGRLVPSHGASRAPAPFRELAITRLLDQRDYHIMVQSWFEATTKKQFDPEYFRIDTNVTKSVSRHELEKPMHERMPRVERHLKEAAARKQPVFVWMHLLATHPVQHKFVPHPQFAWGDSRPERYDSAIAGSDLWLPELEKLMQAHADPTRDTYWIICSDHGVRVETPDRDLYTDIVRVPLIVVGPDIEPGTLDQSVETSVDLAATVVDLAGIAPPETYDGISLVPLLKGLNVGSRMDRRVIPLLRGSWRGAIQGPYKLLLYNKTFSFFDNRADPNEEHNIYDAQKPLARSIWKTAESELERRLAAFEGKAEGESAASSEPDQEPDD